MKNDHGLREHLLYLLKGDGAHLEFDAAVKNIPANIRAQRPSGAAHSPWEVLEHLRITQRDVLDSIRNPNHASPDFPAGYWPGTPAPPDSKAWSASADAFRADLGALAGMAADGSTDLLAPLPRGDGQTILRKLLMLADHNSYHVGQLVLLRRLLGAWQ